MDQADSSQMSEGFSFINPVRLTQVAADMDYTQSLSEPIIKPEVCRCQMCLYTQTLEEELIQDRITIASLQNEQSKTELRFQNFRLQTQRKFKILERKLNENDKVVEETKAATKRLGQAMEQIIMAQEWEKEDNALRALVSLRLAPPKYPSVPEGVDTDS